MSPRRAPRWPLFAVLLLAAPLLMAPGETPCCEACGTFCPDAGEPLDSGPSTPGPVIDAGLPLPTAGLAAGADGCACLRVEPPTRGVVLGLGAGLALLGLRRRRREPR